MKDKIKIILKSLKKHVKLRHLILLIVLLATNTFAWFIYSAKIDTDLTVKVRAWKVSFEAGSTEVENYVNVDIDDAYPGMDDYNYNLTARNNSEVKAKVSIILLEANILGDDILTKEGKQDSNQELTGDEITSEELIKKLKTDYPFKTTFSISDEEMDIDGTSTLNIDLTWPYESNNDELDTEYGMKAYEYKKSNPDSPSIKLKVLFKIDQIV